jgi:hypothetical protein
MQENGGRYSISNPEISSDANQIQINSSFHGEEPPPDPEDFGTKEEEKKIVNYYPVYMKTKKNFEK